MAKGSYPDSLCMIGRSGHFEDSINGVYQRVKGDTKKTEEVRFFYEKSDGVLLCYGSAAWADGVEKPAEKPAEKPTDGKKTKGWMIGWWQDLRPSEIAEGGDAKRLFIAARCPMGDSGNQNFLWEVRDMEGDFETDDATQLVLLPDKEKEGANSPGRVTLRLADEVSLHPDKASPTVGPALREGGFDPSSPLMTSPFAAFQPMPSPLAHLGSPFMGPLGQGMPPPLFASAGDAKKSKKKKSKKVPGATAAAYPAGGLRAEAPAFVPGGHPVAAAGGMLPTFPFMPFPPAEFFARVRPPMGAAASPLVSINAKYVSADEEAVPAGPAPVAPAAPPKLEVKPEVKKTILADGLCSYDTKVEWKLSAVKEKLSKCGKGEGVQSPEFTVQKDGVSGPPMQLTFYPNGHPMSPSGCVAVMLECSAGARMKFKVFAGSQKSGPKVLMGNRFHVDFAGNSVFSPANAEENDDTAPPEMNFDALECGLELIDWM